MSRVLMSLGLCCLVLLSGCQSANKQEDMDLLSGKRERIWRLAKIADNEKTPPTAYVLFSNSGRFTMYKSDQPVEQSPVIQGVYRLGPKQEVLLAPDIEFGNSTVHLAQITVTKTTEQVPELNMQDNAGKLTFQLLYDTEEIESKPVNEWPKEYPEVMQLLKQTKKPAG
jgi:hypothetical protein